MRTVIAAALVFLVTGRGRSDAPMPSAGAGLVLTDGRIYTVDAARRWAEAVAIADGRINNGAVDFVRR